jgi:Timeless protein
MEENSFFDKDLLVSCIDGLGRFSSERTSYEKDLDTLGAHLSARNLSFERLYDYYAYLYDRAECLKDVERFLRQDYEDNKQALLVLGRCGVVSQNLLPLLKTYPHDEEMVYHARENLIRATCHQICKSHVHCWQL